MGHLVAQFFNKFSWELTNILVGPNALWHTQPKLWVGHMVAYPAHAVASLWTTKSSYSIGCQRTHCDHWSEVFRRVRRWRAQKMTELENCHANLSCSKTVSENIIRQDVHLGFWTPLGDFGTAEPLLSPFGLGVYPSGHTTQLPNPSCRPTPSNVEPLPRSQVGVHPPLYPTHGEPPLTLTRK